MENQNLSITRGLKELSLLKSKIQDKINKLTLVDFKQNKYGNKGLRTNQPLIEFEKNAFSSFQSVSDLIAYRDRIKRSIVISNATTMVKIGSEEMTVADAIERKNSIEFKKNLVRKLTAQLATANQEVITARGNLDQQVNNLVEQNTGKDRKIDKDDYEKIAKPFIDANEIKLVDPLKLQEKIDTLKEEIDTFEADVDIVLSESNAKTLINV